MAVTRDEIENFLYMEARLMDEHQYEEWENLWTDDAIYWVPIGGEHTDPKKDVSVIYATRDDIANRIARMKTDMAWSQDPKSGLTRVISNVEVQELPDGDIEVRSNFNLTEHRRRSQVTWLNIWAGRTTHRLRRENGSFKIAYKKVTLVNSDEPIPTLWFLI